MTDKEIYYHPIVKGGEAVYGGALSFLGSMSSNGSVLLDLCLQICSVSTIVVFVVGMSIFI